MTVFPRPPNPGLLLQEREIIFCFEPLAFRILCVKQLKLSLTEQWPLLQSSLLYHQLYSHRLTFKLSKTSFSMHSHVIPVLSIQLNDTTPVIQLQCDFQSPE